MRLFTIRLSICLLAVLISVSARGQLVKPKARYDYMLYLPKEYAANKATYPLLIYLHGGSQRGHDLNQLKGYGPPKEVAGGRAFPFIIAAPQCPDGKYWSTENWFDTLYTELTTRYRIDPRRIYLTGISMGGYGAWQTAVAYPDRFAAIVPLCGGCDDSTQICRIRNVPVWAFHGAADDVIPISETERLARRLKACKGKVTFTRLAGQGHSIEYLYEGKTLYNWLLKHRKRVYPNPAKPVTR
ncbi:phospholipase/carboxylesterase [Fibrella aestuarina BUZ 2]|uniref:Phospholipase/carboxylesterase n=1 Tax=Fibrella aestuarina BUZ 2 TaxID=1166018 RepID=I0K486_9BACT|nr:PHB depolymerase family esterase [Fibrella aestuarina]CCG98939.1 phospholipase/carboxylesterase [Fibrella aestuarina BUZ 2]